MINFTIFEIITMGLKHINHYDLQPAQRPYTCLPKQSIDAATQLIQTNIVDLKWRLTSACERLCETKPTSQSPLERTFSVKEDIRVEARLSSAAEEASTSTTCWLREEGRWKPSPIGRSSGKVSPTWSSLSTTSRATSSAI